MNKEDMYNGISGIRPEYLKEADSYKPVRVIKWRKWVAAAACAALVMTAGVTGLTGNIFKDGESDPFTVTAYAQTMEEGKALPLSVLMDNISGWGLEESEDHKDVEYLINEKFTCEGDGISSVTYSINNGAFYILDPKEDGILTDYELYDGPELHTPEAGVDNISDYNVLRVTSYTVAYDKQTSDTTYTGICGVKTDENLVNTIFDALAEEKTPVEDKIAALTELMEDTEITCTVNYDNGSADSKTIIVIGCADADDPGLDDFAYELK